MMGITGSYTPVFYPSSILHDGITHWRTRLEFIATEYPFNFGTHFKSVFFYERLTIIFLPMPENVDHRKGYACLRRDSLAGNQNFRNRLLDTVSTVAELKAVRKNGEEKLKTKIKEFRTLYPDRDRLIMKYKILDAVNNLISVIFVGMAIPVIIYIFKRR